MDYCLGPPRGQGIEDRDRRIAELEAKVFQLERLLEMYVPELSQEENP